MSKPIPAHLDTLWEVEVKTALPVRNTPEMPLSVSVEAVMDIQIPMKGLLDLRRTLIDRSTVKFHWDVN